MASHLFPTQGNTEVMEISEAFAGEAGAAAEAGDIGQSREVIVQQFSLCCLHIQCTVTATDCVILHTFRHA